MAVRLTGWFAMYSFHARLLGSMGGGVVVAILSSQLMSRGRELLERCLLSCLGGER